MNDALSSFAKFANPTVAQGRVYVPTFSNEVDVYGSRSDINQALPEIEVVNAFSRLSGAVSPGELISIRGRDLGIGTETTATPDSDSGALPTSLSGITVAFDDQFAAVVSASPEEIRVVVPYSVAGKANVTLQVTNLGLAAAPLAISTLPRRARVCPHWMAPGPVQAHSSMRMVRQMASTALPHRAEQYVTNQ